MTTQTKPGNKAGEFLRGVRLELKKVSWPNRKDMINYTTVVIVMCTLATAFMWVVDAFFHAGLQFIIK
jgi:preprotein translocase subunit SecE